MLTVRWLGVAGLEIRVDDQVLLCDPYLSRPSKLATLLRPMTIDRTAVDRYLAALNAKVPAILVGHTHSDHVLDVPGIVQTTQAKALGTASLANLLDAYGLEERVTVVEPGRSYTFGPFKVRPIESVHGRAILGRIPFPGEIPRGLTPPLRVNKYRHGGPLIWHIEAEGLRMLQVGSADFIEANLRDVQVDVAFLCAAGRQSTPDFARRLLDILQPRVVVPFHFDDFFSPVESGKFVPGVDLDGFVREIQSARPKARVVVPKPFVELEL